MYHYLYVILPFILSFIIIHAFNSNNKEIKMKFKLFSLVERESIHYNKVMDSNRKLDYDYNRSDRKSNDKSEFNKISSKHNNLVEKIISSTDSKHHSNNIISSSSPSSSSVLLDLPSLQDIQTEAMYTKRNIQSVDFCMKTSGYPSKIIKKSIYLNILTSLQEEKSKLQRSN